MIEYHVSGSNLSIQLLNTLNFSNIFFVSIDLNSIFLMDEIENPIFKPPRLELNQSNLKTKWIWYFIFIFYVDSIVGSGKEKWRKKMWSAAIRKKPIWKSNKCSPHMQRSIFPLPKQIFIFQFKGKKKQKDFFQ